MSLKHFLIPFFFLAILTGCTSLKADLTSESESSSSSAAMEETRNVSYIGRVAVNADAAATGSPYVLAVDASTMIQLQSTLVNFQDYLGKDVQVTGNVRPSADGVGRILTVEQIAILLAEESSSSSSSEASSASFESIASESSEALSSMESSVTSVSLPSSKAATSRSQEAMSAAMQSSAPVSEVGAALAANAGSMAKQKMGSEQWTQQYCSSHIGFCVPIHRNWWYQSFHEDATVIAHVEVSGSEITQIGQGPIVIRLKSDASGTLESKGVTDGSVREESSYIVGYRAWRDGRHFEISAPAILRDAVSYMTKQLASYEQPTP
jgi:hypothetical protein